jgi:DNA-directed RNA polymerase subunit RPC12/RpoP
METVALRCTNCGAPLPKPQQGEEWVRCEYCGFLNKIVDATRYVERLKGELQKWIRELLPPAAVSATVADVAARHQIFQGLIKPKLLMARANIRAKYLQYLSNPLTPIPPPTQPGEEPKVFFEETLKIQAVKDFAVSEEDSKFVYETIVYGNTAGYVLNAILALSRFDVKSALKNIDEALSEIPEDPGFTLMKQRLSAVKSMLASLEQLYARNTTAALDLAKTGVDQYNLLLERVGSSPIPEVNKGVLEVEKIAAESIYRLSDAAHKFFTAGRDPLEIVKWVETYMSVFKWLRDTFKRPVQDLVEIMDNLKKLAYSKTGSPEVNVLPGRGSLYVPFHVVECRFSFVKGIVFRKGGESRLTVLVASIPPYVENPVLDVLGVYTGRMPPPERIEEAPGYSLAKNIVSSAISSSMPGEVRAFPPFISSVLAEKLVDGYIEAVNNKYRGKITFASSQAVGLVYIPFNTLDQKTLVNEKGLSIRLTVELNNLLKLTI